MKNILVAGGDRRAIWLARTANERGYNVQACGFDDCEGPVHSIHIDDASGADVIVLPLPYRKDGCIPTPLGKPIAFSKLEPLLKKAKLVIAGRADEPLYELASRFGFTALDVYGGEAYTMYNAIPSSEGAIHAAMSLGTVTLHGSECLVTGFGRIGKVLSKQLSGLGAHVTVYARKHQDRALAEALGYRAVSALTPGIYRFIFNTVPHLLFDRATLELVRPDALIIDVSSAPYGVDFEAARELSVKTSLEPALPGRYSPETAGLMLYNAIEPYLGGRT